MPTCLHVYMNMIANKTVVWWHGEDYLPRFVIRQLLLAVWVVRFNNWTLRDGMSEDLRDMHIILIEQGPRLRSGLDSIASIERCCL